MQSLHERDFRFVCRMPQRWFCSPKFVLDSVFLRSSTRGQRIVIRTFIVFISSVSSFDLRFMAVRVRKEVSRLI